MRRLRKLAWALPLAIALVGATNGVAATIRIEFAGTVTIVSSSLRDGTVEVGDTVFGTVEVATDPGSDSNPTADVGRYDYVSDEVPIASFDLVLGDYSAQMATGAPSSPQNHHVEVRDDYTFVPQDAFFVAANADGSGLNGFAPEYMQFGLVSSDLSRLTGTELPTLEELLGFAIGEGTQATNFLSFGGADSIRWNLTSLSFLPIPEPSTLLLVGVGLLTLSGSRRRANRPR